VKRPSFQFYPSDWRNDSGLRLCSLAARGLWVEMMCIAHECDEYGKLTQNGRGFSHKTLAKLVGLSPQTCLKLLKELEDNKVFSRDENGAIFSRRMVRDEEIRQIRAEAGSKGGNPLLLGNLVKQTGKQKPTPSSSSSSSMDLSIRRGWTLEEVTAAGQLASVTPEVCKAYYDAREAVGWVDRNAIPIKSMPHDLSRFASHWAENERKRPATALTKPKGVWDAKQGIDALKAKLERMKGDPRNRRQKADCPWETEWKPEAKAEVARIREKIRELEGVVAA